MRLNEMDLEHHTPIDGYGPGGFRVAGRWREGSLILLPGEMLPLQGPPSAQTLAPVLEAADEVDVLLVGMGDDIRPLPRPLVRQLEGAGIGVEIMSTPSACRTYNVLLTEERRVAIALVAL